jgi:hypothetical protein
MQRILRLVATARCTSTEKIDGKIEEASFLAAKLVRIAISDRITQYLLTCSP